MFKSIWVGLLSLAMAGIASFAATTHPNIVVFLTDDHGCLDSEVYGATDVKTPNMRRLAESGMTFTRAFAASPSCAPSRAALLTGLMPARNGAEANHSKPRAEVKKLPAYLQELGYDVAGFGKVAHYNHDPEYGFDHYDKRNDQEVVAEYLNKRDRSKPLCLFVGQHLPHVPWTTNAVYDPAAVRLPPTHLDTPPTREFRARYYTDVSKADQALGETMELAKRRLGTNLVFIYSSDHGAQWPFGKWNLYDAGIQVPLIVSWPGTVPPGKKTEALVSWVDILPTLIQIAGGRPPADIDGRSFLAVLRQGATKHRERIFATHSGDGRMNVYPIRAVRTADWKFIWNLHPEFSHTTHIDLAKDRDGLKYWRTWVSAGETNATARALVRRYRDRPKEELYDLRNDPFEEHNLIGEPSLSGRIAELREELNDWMKDQNDRQTVFNEPRLRTQ